MSKSPEESLPDEVARLLGGSKRRLRDVATDAGVSLSWVHQFLRGAIKNPGYLTLMRLREVLSRDVVDESFTASISGELAEG